MYLKKSGIWFCFLAFALTGCPDTGRLPANKPDNRIASVQPQTVTGDSSIRLVLANDLDEINEVQVRIGQKMVDTFSIPGPRTILTHLPACKPGLNSIEVLQGKHMVAQMKNGLLCMKPEHPQITRPEKPEYNIERAGAKKTGSGPGSNWWMLHQDLEHTANMRLQQIMTPLAEKWKHTYEDALGYTQVIKGENMLLAGLYGNGPESLVALDPVSGNVIWEFMKTIPDGVVNGTPVAIDGKVYFVEGFTSPVKLHAIDLLTGSLVWSKELPAASQAGLASAFGKIYVLTRSGSLRSHDAQTGALIWEESINVGYGDTLSSPAVGFGNVYVGTGKGIRVFDANTGTPKWAGEGPANGNASPVIVTDVGVGNPAVVAIGSTDNKLRAYQAVTGTKLWEFTGDMGLWYTTPATAEGKLYLQQDRTILALDAVTGNQTAVSPDLGAKTATAPTINGKELFVITRDDELHALALGNLSVIQTLNINSHQGGEPGQPSTESGWLYFQAHKSDPWPAAADTIYGYSKE